MSGSTRHSGRWTQDDRCASPWHYLPVEVPPGAAGLRVELDYDRSGAVLDLGCFGPAGFRGWSGGARSSFVITPREATPGYLPGELEPGLWQVVIGLYRLPAEGAGYSVTASVSTTPGRPAPGARAPRSRPCSASGRRGASCPPGRGTAGWPGTCTRTPSTRMARSPWPS